MGRIGRLSRLWRPLHTGVRLLLLAATLSGTVSVLRQSPFTAAVVERSPEEVRGALDRAVARAVTADWLIPRLTAALDADPPEIGRAEMLAGLAEDHGIALPPDLVQALAARRAAEAGMARATLACAGCALDLHDCPTIRMLAICGVPPEMTPLGDLNALRRAAGAALAGEEVDRLDVGLALAGLGATALIPVTGGSSAAIKAGATGVRLGRRMGTLTPGLADALSDAADLPVNWSAVMRNAPLPEVTDIAGLDRLAGIAQDVGRIARHTSPAEALVLLRHVESAGDAARMARLAEAAGPGTRRAVEVLGKARAFRALVRLTDLALGAIVLIYAAILQFALILAQWIGVATVHALRPTRRPVARMPRLRHDRAV